MSKRGMQHLIPVEMDIQCEFAQILVIDDEPLITRFAQASLKKSGFASVHSLNDPTLAFEVIERIKPDLIILDIEMPGRNGLELLQELRSHYSYCDIPVLILSGADKASKYRSLKLGAVDFIDKPVDSDELEVRVRKALRVI